MESFRKDLKAAGIEEVDGRGRRVVLHSLRHSLATMLAASQVPMAVAQRIMRRRDIRLTAEVYTDEGMLPLAAGVRALPVFSIPAPAPAFRHRARSAQTASLKVQKESIASVPPENTQVPEFVPSMRHRGSFVGTVAPTGTC